MREYSHRISLTFGIGNIVALVLSWATHHSVLWAIIDFLFGWLYVIFWLFFR